MTITDKKTIARKRFKDAREKLAKVSEKYKAATGKLDVLAQKYKDARAKLETLSEKLSNERNPEVKNELRADRRKTKKLVEVLKKSKVEATKKKKDLFEKRGTLKTKVEELRQTWHDAAEMEKKTHVTRKEKKKGPKVLHHPKPEGFEFILRHREFWKGVIDKNWKPPKAQCRMLGKYFFADFLEPNSRVRALVTVKSDLPDGKLKVALQDYFSQDEAKLYFGDVRVLSIFRSSEKYRTKRIDVTISTDFRKVQGFIRDLNK